jgi:hypothetical protein
LFADDDCLQLAGCEEERNRKEEEEDEEVS